jgi:hypothetical protein
MPPGLDWYDAIFELIDMRSFSNLWYWISLAVLWSSVSHFVMGVPFDMLTRARRQGGQAERDFEDMVRISINRIEDMLGRSGLWMMGFVSFVLTSVGLLGFYYWIEFAQALMLLGAPLVLVGALTVRTARRITREGLTGEPLRQRLLTTRFWVQVVGMVSIFITSMWGMYQNLDLGGLYG